MRTLVLAVIVCLGALLGPALLDTNPSWDFGTASAMQEKPEPRPIQVPDIDVDIDTDEGGGAWYANPVWIAIGGIALVVLLVLVVLAGRGGGTTVVRG